MIRYIPLSGIDKRCNIKIIFKKAGKSASVSIKFPMGGYIRLIERYSPVGQPWIRIEHVHKEEQEVSFTVKYDPELSIIESVLADNVTGEDLRMHEAQSIALAKETNSTRFLTDATQVTLKVSMPSLYDLPEFYQDQGLSRPVLIAVLPPTSEAGKRLVDFYETVCLNRGWTVGIFGERQEALDWLLKDETKT
jgi:hypothetical protein